MFGFQSVSWTSWIALCHLWPRGWSLDDHFDPCNFLNPKRRCAILSTYIYIYTRVTGTPHTPNGMVPPTPQSWRISPTVENPGLYTDKKHPKPSVQECRIELPAPSAKLDHVQLFEYVWKQGIPHFTANLLGKMMIHPWVFAGLPCFSPEFSGTPVDPGLQTLASMPDLGCPALRPGSPAGTSGDESLIIRTGTDDFFGSCV